MASDPGCSCFSLLFRIRLSLPSRFSVSSPLSCLPAFLLSHGFPAVPLFRFLPAFLPARGFSCIHCGFGALFVIRPVRPIAVFPTAVGLTLFPAGLVFVRLVVCLACPTDCCLSDRCWSDPLSGRPVVRLACCRSACPTDCCLFDRCWSDPLSGRPDIRPACCPSGPPSALSSALSSALPSGYRAGIA